MVHPHRNLHRAVTHVQKSLYIGKRYVISANDASAPLLRHGPGTLGSLAAAGTSSVQIVVTPAVAGTMHGAGSIVSATITLPRQARPPWPRSRHTSQHRGIKTWTFRRQRNAADHTQFTLLELLVVMFFIRLLAACAGPRYFAQVRKAPAKTAKAQIVAIGKALDQYRLDPQEPSSLPHSKL